MNFSKWLAAGDLVQWLSTQSYLYLAAIVAGAASTATIRAATVLFGPLHVINFYVASVLPREFSIAYAQGGANAIESRLHLASTIVALITLAYCLLVAVLAAPLLHALYGTKYSTATSAVVLLAIFYLLVGQIPIVASGLRALRATRSVFFGSMWSALSLPVGSLLIQRWEADGAIAGMIVSAIASYAYARRAYRRKLAEERRPRSPYLDDTAKAQP
jgi:O-antigen/teichoic acid export membrane protein